MKLLTSDIFSNIIQHRQLKADAPIELKYKSDLDNNHSEEQSKTHHHHVSNKLRKVITRSTLYAHDGLNLIKRKSVGMDLDEIIQGMCEEQGSKAEWILRSIYSAIDELCVRHYPGLSINEARDRLIRDW